MSSVTVVGSGPSGVHFARTLLDEGRTVTLIDVGREKPEAVLPERPLLALKDELADPAGYFLGAQYEGVVLPGQPGEYYGFPPDKSYVFEELETRRIHADGFAPLLSFARGGLAEAWTGGCYPYRDEELADFPLNYAELAPGYEEVARRIGINGVADDLSRFYPLHEGLQPPLELSPGSRALLAAYERRRDRINARERVYVGRARAAALSADREARKACWYSGRCLWGCPSRSLYTPSLTLADCLAHPDFDYLSGLEALFFRAGPEGRVRALVAAPVTGGPEVEIPVEALVLAAGTLSTAKIVLRSIHQRDGVAPPLAGLMDNRQVLLPFANLRLMGQPYEAESYQYHQLGIGLEADDPRHYVHGLITTLTTALMHPIVQRLPLDLATSTAIGRFMHAALGMVNVNFHDTRRDGNRVELRPGSEGAPPGLSIRYQAPAGETERIRAVVRTLRSVLRRLGCVVPPGMTHIRPMGASVHYSGTLPMTREDRPLTTTSDCRVRGFANLFVVDGSIFPFLPAKNLTFTLMANAVRVARIVF